MMNGKRNEHLGVIRICSVCHKVIGERETLARIEAYAKEYMGVKFSHGYCSKCFQLELDRVQNTEIGNRLAVETNS